MTTAILLSKGAVIIPNRFRKALHLQPGDRVTLDVEGDQLVIRRDTSSHARLVQGKFGRPVWAARKGAPPMLPELVKTLLNDPT